MLFYHYLKIALKIKNNLSNKFLDGKFSGTFFQFDF